jgi:dolichyl-phosphate-mannose-protein mannosyltransferase
MSAGRLRLPGGERTWGIALLAIHLALAVWGAAVNSVTFDENFHVPAGVVEVARGDLLTSAVNPPLVKAMFGAAALAAGARMPADSAIARIEQSIVGESFRRRNADRYHRVFFAARLVVVLLSLALGWLVWRFARRLYGPGGGLLALAFYAFAPEAIAHGGLATLEIATALGFMASVYTCWDFARRPSVGAWLGLLAAVVFTALTRFSALALALLLPALAAILARRGRRRYVWLGLALLLPAAVIGIDLGYLGKVSFRPLQTREFASEPFRALQHACPALRLPLPDDWLAGLDWQTREGARGETPAYLFGRILSDPVWYYFPVAILCKWPLGFLAALLARAGLGASFMGSAARRAREFLVLAVPTLVLMGAMFVLTLDVGVRYVFPMLPFLCVWCGGLWSRGSPGPRRFSRALARGAVVLASLVAVESSMAAPWHLSFFNRLAGGPGGGYRILNDSNVDWGQGLIALRAEMKRLHVSRIHLAYHGTTDPAMYGIDYVPYLGGEPGAESDWLAVSSFYFIGMTQRMMTTGGRTPPLRLDFRPLWGRKPDAVLAGSMYLFKVR